MVSCFNQKHVLNSCDIVTIWLLGKGKKPCVNIYIHNTAKSFLFSGLSVAGKMKKTTTMNQFMKCNNEVINNTTTSLIRLNNYMYIDSLQ